MTKASPSPEQEPQPKTAGVVDLWRSTRQMIVWQTASAGDWMIREIGPNLSVRHKVGEGIIHFDAPRKYWDELLSDPRPANCGIFTVPKDVLAEMLEQLDNGRPALTLEASKRAAHTQAMIEAEAREDGQRLDVVGFDPSFPTNPLHQA